MLITPIQLKIAKFAAIAAAIMFAMVSIYLAGLHRGENQVTAKWNAEKLQNLKATLVLQGEIKERESVHRQEATRIADELRKTEDQHEKTVAALRAEHADRMRLSTERAALYKRLSEGGSASCTRLASHASELDGSLEEGRGLVSELAAALGQREDQLKLLGAQILADRQLLGTK